jgi:hypothetical protein
LLLEKPLEAPDNALPSPRQLFGKIILKHKKLATPLEPKSPTATTAGAAATSDSATAALPANNGNLNGREVPPTPPTSLAFTSTQEVLYTKAIYYCKSIALLLFLRLLVHSGQFFVFFWKNQESVFKFFMNF